MALALSLGVLVATKPHPTLPEVVLATAFVASQLDDRTLASLRLLPAACLGLGVGALASAPLLSAWLDTRQLNANFFYAATVLTGAAQLLLVYDVAAAALHVAREAEEGQRSKGRGQKED